MIQAYRYNGKPISVPGAYVGAPIDAYHEGTLCAGPSISSTGLREVLASPMHYWDRSPWNPDREEDDGKEKSEYIFGRAAHTWTFERDHFEDRFMVLPEDAPKRPSKSQRKAKSPSADTVRAIEYWDDIEAEARHLLTADDMDRITKMERVLARDEYARMAFAGDGLAEVTLVYKDEATGVWVLSRPDWIANQIADFKTAASADAEAWSRKAYQLGYVMQAALMRKALAQATGEHRQAVFHCIQEKERPFAVQVARWPDDQLQYGEVMLQNALTRLARCRDENKWPAYGAEPFDVQPPYHVRKLIELQA